MLLPLKQGLKHFALADQGGGAFSCYATSIKTRIETVKMKGEKMNYKGLLCYFH